MGTGSKRSRIWMAAGVKAAVLLLIVALWPVSCARRYPLAIGVEKTPAFGWQIFTDGYTFFPGYAVGVDQGYLFAFAFDVCPNPKPPLTGPYLSWYSSDTLRWHFNPQIGIGFGVILTGSPFSPHWNSRTGFMLALWPMAILCLILLARLIWKTRRTLKSTQQSLLCAGCGYDLRAHKPGDRCPECGNQVMEKRGSA